jgi:hypothetical protein
MAKLICSKCGSKEFEPWSTSTLMVGPNKHTYTCAQCGNQEEVWDSGKAFQPREINLGPDDKVVPK